MGLNLSPSLEKLCTPYTGDARGALGVPHPWDAITLAKLADELYFYGEDDKFIAVPSLWFDAIINRLSRLDDEYLY